MVEAVHKVFFTSDVYDLGCVTETDTSGATLSETASSASTTDPSNNPSLNAKSKLPGHAESHGKRSLEGQRSQQKRPLLTHQFWPRLVQPMEDTIMAAFTRHPGAQVATSEMVAKLGLLDVMFRVHRDRLWATSSSTKKTPTTNGSSHSETERFLGG